MKTDKAITKIENWSSEKMTYDNLYSQTKVELVRYCNTFIGGSWWYLRRQTKHDLVFKILDHEKRYLSA